MRRQCRSQAVLLAKTADDILAAIERFCIGTIAVQPQCG
jgi:hypothetical protein